jgi:hypothetical protein
MAVVNNAYHMLQSTKSKDAAFQFRVYLQGSISK